MKSIQRELFGPGPTNPPASILRALSLPTIGHLDPEFLRIMDETSESLRYCKQPQNATTDRADFVADALLSEL